MTGPTPPALDDIRLGEPEFWMTSRADRERAFATLRREHPIAFHEEPEVPGLGRGPGFWSLTRHADVLEASRNGQLFSSARGGVNMIDQPEFFAEFFGSMIAMDDPRHARLRGSSRAASRRRVLRNVDGRRRARRGRDRRRRHRPRPLRLRDRRRRDAAAQDHLRHDGHSRERVPLRLRPHQRDSRRDRSRVRRRSRAGDPGHPAGRAGARHVGGGSRRRP